MKCQLLIIATFLISTLSLAQNTSFDQQTPPPAPDYSLKKNWAALPFREDAADVIPKTENWISDSVKQVDVFYVHPTLYTRGKAWNADVNDQRQNRKVDKKPIHYQASVFNRSCRVYAPRYRQALVDVFYESSPDSAKALDLAYSDVKRAFDFYLEHYNHGRPLIIASHSQGTVHCRRLLQEYFDGTALQEQLVAAYVIGYSVNEKMYQQLELCKNAKQTGCFISWMSYKKGFYPKHSFHVGTQSINPLNWTIDTTKVGREHNKGTVVLNINRRHEQKTAARIVQDKGEILWIDTKAPLLNLFKSMHILDYNLFWYDIRENVAERVEAYFKE